MTTDGDGSSHCEPRAEDAEARGAGRGKDGVHPELGGGLSPSLASDVSLWG